MIYYKILSLFCIFAITKGNLHPNVGLDVYQIITKYGFPYETHHIITEDGYILETIRLLPHTDSKFSPEVNLTSNQVRSFSSNIDREPILLVHGFMSSAHGFVLHDPDKALAFILCQAGYDVWIANTRGTKLSRRHTSLDPDLDAKQFWDFSLHEIGVYDLPAMIDYILGITNYDKLSLVGHSQGGTNFLIMLADRPEYNAKIKIAFAFGGAAIMRYTPNDYVRRIAVQEKDIKKTLNRLEIYEFFQQAKVVLDAVKILCDEQFGLRGMFNHMLQMSNVLTTYNLDMDLVPVIMSQYPNGASWNQLIHYMQLVKYGEFKAFDYYNKSKNIKKYGSAKAHKYDLGSITAKVILYHSQDDFWVGPKDTLLMAKQMKNAIAKEIKVKNFSHMDYMWARKVVDMVFKDLMWRLQNE